VADIGPQARQEAAHGAKADKPKGTSRLLDYRIREQPAGLLTLAGAEALSGATCARGGCRACWSGAFWAL